MTEPCETCKRCIKKVGIAGGYFCTKKNAIVSIARITDKNGHRSNENCHEPIEKN